MARGTGTKAAQQPQNASQKNTSSHGGLPTPEPTPGVEHRRVAAELARKAAEAATNHVENGDELKDPQREIERLMRGSKDAYAKILAVDPSSGEEDGLVADAALAAL